MMWQTLEKFFTKRISLEYRCREFEYGSIHITPMNLGPFIWEGFSHNKPILLVICSSSQSNRNRINSIEKIKLTLLCSFKILKTNTISRFPTNISTGLFCWKEEIIRCTGSSGVYSYVRIGAALQCKLTLK